MEKSGVWFVYAVEKLCLEWDTAHVCAMTNGSRGIFTLRVVGPSANKLRKPKIADMNYSNRLMGPESGRSWDVGMDPDGTWLPERCDHSNI